VLEDFEPNNEDMRGGEEMNLKKAEYKIDFRLPLKGINSKLISPTQLNVCNMFSTLYFMQLVVILKSESIKVPGKRVSRADNGYKTIES
jgi:hypothetical protein|tara:strand:+ start:710 stop:976 length:267 start_codon:yes stop_codon:yes gene_type:complete